MLEPAQFDANWTQRYVCLHILKPARRVGNNPEDICVTRFPHNPQEIMKTEKEIKSAGLVGAPDPQRVNVKLTNTLENPIICRGVLCQGLQNPKTGALWADGDVIEPGALVGMLSESNDRIFAQFESQIKGVNTGIMFQIAMTVPGSSCNSAAGYFGNEGLQKYNDDTPATFIFNIGEKNLASWSDCNGLGTDPPAYGDC